MYKIYGNQNLAEIDPDIVITEDSNSGYEFFDEVFPGKCISSNGKSNIKKLLVKQSEEKILVIVDGAAFGPEMQGCMELIRTSSKNIVLYAPESFEYLILKSGTVEIPKELLYKTWEYAESTRFFSWEEFYTHELGDRTRNTIKQYSKKHLNDFYKSKGSIEKICSVFPVGILG